MRNPLARVPWQTGAPAFLVCAVALAIATNLFGGDYFKRTFLEEDNPLAAGGSGGPAAVVSATPSPAGTPVAAATTAGSIAPAGPVVLASGMFRDGAPGHHGKGTAKLGRDAAGKAILVFEGFSVTNGPEPSAGVRGSTSGG